MQFSTTQRRQYPVPLSKSLVMPSSFRISVTKLETRFAALTKMTAAHGGSRIESASTCSRTKASAFFQQAAQRPAFVLIHRPPVSLQGWALLCQQSLLQFLQLLAHSVAHDVIHNIFGREIRTGRFAFEGIAGKIDLACLDVTSHNPLAALRSGMNWIFPLATFTSVSSAAINNLCSSSLRRACPGGVRSCRVADRFSYVLFLICR